MALVFTGGGVGRRTSNELEGLGLDGLVGVNFRNGTHFGDVYSERTQKGNGNGRRGEVRREVEMGRWVIEAVKSRA